LLATGFEAALIGICYRCSQPPLATYSRKKCIEILVDQGMFEGDADEYFEFNVVGAWMGENTPVFVDVLSWAMPADSSRVRSAVTLIASLTALVTALTSLVKATDKSVERLSYEMIARKIAEVQEHNASLHKDLDALEIRSSVSNPLPPSSSSAVLPFVGSPSPFATSAPSANAPSVSQARPVSPPQAPLPPWKTVKARAEKHEF